VPDIKVIVEVRALQIGRLPPVRPQLVPGFGSSIFFPTAWQRLPGAILEALIVYQAESVPKFRVLWYM
jgi:hypothetical protein